MYSLKRKVVFPIIIPRYMLYLSAFLPTCIPTYLHSYLPAYLPTYLPTYNNTIFFKALMVVVAFPQRWAFSVRARQRSKAWITLKDLNRMQFISFNHIYKYIFTVKDYIFSGLFREGLAYLLLGFAHTR